MKWSMNHDMPLYGPLAIATIYSDAGMRPVHGVKIVEFMALVCGQYLYRFTDETAESTCQAELWAMAWALDRASEAGLRTLRLIGDNEIAILLMRGEKKTRKAEIRKAVEGCRRAASDMEVTYVFLHRDHNLAGDQLGDVQTKLRRMERRTV